MCEFQSIAWLNSFFFFCSLDLHTERRTRMHYDFAFVYVCWSGLATAAPQKCIISIMMMMKMMCITPHTTHCLCVGTIGTCHNIPPLKFSCHCHPVVLCSSCMCFIQAGRHYYYERAMA